MLGAHANGDEHGGGLAADVSGVPRTGRVDGVLTRFQLRATMGDGKCGPRPVPGDAQRARPGADRDPSRAEALPLDVVGVPQIVGLGFSDMTRRYGFTSVDEASAYLDDPGLGSDYAEMVDAVRQQVVGGGVTVHDLFGSPDDGKLVASLTLFAGIARQRHPEFSELAAKAGDILSNADDQGLAPCRTTLEFLAMGGGAG